MRKGVMKRLFSLLMVTVMVAALLPADLQVKAAANNAAGDSNIFEEADHVHDGITFTAWSDPASLPAEAGHYYLTCDVTLSSKWYAAPGVTDLCLNGHSITGQTELAGDDPEQVVLDLYDCENTGKLTVSGGTLLNISSNATFNMYGGSVSGCDHSGECIRVMFDTSVFNMYAGSVKNNKGSYIVNGAGHFNMYGGTISNNTGIGVNVANFSISGNPVIRNNKVTSGDSEEEKNVWFMALSRIAIAGELTEGADIGVTLNKSLSCAEPFVLTSGLSGKGDASAFSADEGYSVRVNGDGEAELYVGHSWGEPNWVWADDHSSAAATFTCTVCGDEQEVTDSAPVETQVSAADCENDKVVKYTAKVTFEGEEYSDTTEEVVLSGTATGHTYRAPEWEWAADYSNAAATFRCAGEDDEQTVTDNSPEMIVVSEETCTADKVVKYEASVTFEGGTFTDKTDNVIIEGTALDHSWGEWTQTAAPSCTTDGEETRTCSRCSETETRPVTALGHSWKAPEWNWEGHASATATFVCERDADGSHTEVLNAEIKSEQGTGEDLGKTVYTATVVGPDGETYTDVLKETNTYTVTWKNWDGEILETDENVPYGTVPTYDGEMPVRDPDEEGHYSFTGWSPEVAEVGGDTVYAAVFASEAHAYGEPEWNWTETDDGWTASAVFACSDCGFELTVPAEGLNYEVTKEPTDNEGGEGTYTATVTGPDGRTYTGTKTVAIAKLAWHITVTDYTKGAATTTVNAETLYKGENIFTATCAYDAGDKIVDAGCVIAIDNGDGTYTKLDVTTANGVHSFTVTVTDADVNLVIVLKGDANLNGAIDGRDMTRIQNDYLEIPGKELTALQKLAADANVDGIADGRDMTRIQKFYLHGTDTLRIAHASSSETFGKYGEAPNQRRTGVTEDNPGGNMDGELNVMENPFNWTVIYRPVNKTRAEFIASFVIAAVANGSHIGYGQNGRTGVFDSLQAMNSTDPAEITDLVNCDCATLVGAAVYYSGLQWSTLRKLCTWEMVDVLGGSEEFIVLTDDAMLHSGAGIKRGDILFRSGHTAVSIDSDNVIPW